MATQELPRTKGHVFYEQVNRILEEDGFDRFVEDACEKFYAPVMGRPGVVPGMYFWHPIFTPSSAAPQSQTLERVRLVLRTCSIGRSRI